MPNRGVDRCNACVVRRDVGERQPRRHVAGGIDARRTGAQAVVDDDRAAWVDLDGRPLTS